MEKIQSRTKKLINILFPEKITLKDENKESAELNKYAICLNFVGTTYHLNITNSISNLKQFESKEYLQKSLLNSNNDIIDFIKFLKKKNEKNFEFEICSKITKNYLEDSILSKLSKKKSLILYFSGHGTNKNEEFYFNFSKKNNSNNER